MLHVGLDLSRKRLDYRAIAEDGSDVDVGASPPDADGLRGLAERLARHGEPVQAAIESMNGARFVHDQLELHGWEVKIAESRRGLVQAIWLPDPEVRAERERARWRLHLVRHRTALKGRVHQTLVAFGQPCPVSDLFGERGRLRARRSGQPFRGNRGEAKPAKRPSRLVLSERPRSHNLLVPTPGC